MVYNIFGSDDSLDVDAIFVVDSPMSLQECKVKCQELDELNGMDNNLCCVKKGVMTWVYKGSVDEVNNSVYCTYNLHHQAHPIIVKDRVFRDIGLKMARTIRTVLQYASRSDYRPLVKSALKSKDVREKLDALKEINFDEQFELNKPNLNWIAYRKAIAFSSGQLFALEFHLQLYTKSGVSQCYPELHDYVYRVETTNYGLNEIIDRIIGLAESMDFDNIKEEK